MPLSLPLTYYPSTVVLIDDDDLVLRITKAAVLDIAPCETFSDPSKAIGFIKDNRQEFANYNPLDHRCVSDKARFSEVSIVVVDYSMPSMNGIEVCEQLQDLGVKIVLLTGDADETIAVDAFNNKLINRYVKKSAENLHETLIQCLHDLQKDWCKQKSIECLNVIANDVDSDVGDGFCDNELKAWFMDLIATYRIVEYYFVSAPGDILLIDDKGKSYFLTIKNENEFDELVEMAMDQYEGIENVSLERYFQRLKDKKQILFFYNDSDYKTGPEDWKGFFHPCQNVSTSTGKYYYAVIDVASSVYDLPKVCDFTELSSHF